jgi:uncharacterized protein YecE (DUF72 family)
MTDASQPSFFDDDPPGDFPDADGVRFGTSSFSSTDWVGPFYPRGLKPSDFLRFYATRFSTVEIDATYYHVPAASTVDSWVRKTPESFTIAAKFPRGIVHAGAGIEPDPERILTPDATYAERDEFLQVMGRLGKRLGPLLLQFPRFAPTSLGGAAGFRERLDRFLGDLPPGFQIAVEIRNPEWLDESFAQLLHKHGATPVLVDRAGMPHGAAVFDLLHPDRGRLAYIRLLGDRHRIEKITTTFDHEVLDWSEHLERWADLLVRLSHRRIPTFVFANNHFAGHAPATIRRLATRYDAARMRKAESPDPDISPRRHS